MDLADVYFEHAMVMYSMLPQHGTKEIRPGLRSFYESLPQTSIITTKKAIEVGKTFGLCDKTTGNNLNELSKEGSY